MKKIISLFLTVLFVISVLAACGDTGTGDATTAGQDNADATTEAPAETELVSATLFDALDWGGTEVNFLSRDVDFVRDEIFVEKVNGETVNDAIYRRNQLVEEYLDVEIENKMLTGDNYVVSSAVRTAVNSGSKDVEILANSTYSYTPTKTCFTTSMTANISTSTRHTGHRASTSAQASATGSIWQPEPSRSRFTVICS